MMPKIFIFIGIGIFASIVSLILFFYTPHHSVTINTEIKIVATPNQVWDVITDLQSYPQWNPYHIAATSSLIKGDEVFLSLDPVPQ
ncbi:MAG: hypothetical protein KUG82_03650 [Pseudomonadales bacterium]|nr:hypothetical protein [Pseudomonadales bacterium]